LKARAKSEGGRFARLFIDDKVSPSTSRHKSLLRDLMPEVPSAMGREDQRQLLRDEEDR